VVGRLSGIGTVGAIVGTVVTGFVLISRVPVSGIMVGLGIALVVPRRCRRAAFRTLALGRRAVLLLGLSGVGAAVALRAAATRRPPTTARWWSRPRAGRPGRVLLLDGAPHSYVDLADPTHLEFAYAKGVVAAIDTAYRRASRCGRTTSGPVPDPAALPGATRPGTTSVVSEIDPGSSARPGTSRATTRRAGIQVRVEDGSAGPDPAGRRQPGPGGRATPSAGSACPWHLTTRERPYARSARVLTGDGTYVVNMIDRGPLAFARAEVATLRSEFARALMARTDTLAGPGGGNLVAIASPAPIDTAGSPPGWPRTDTGGDVITGAELDAWVDGAPVLTDDYAPGRPAAHAVHGPLSPRVRPWAVPHPMAPKK
jgi:hypothetical protein